MYEGAFQTSKYHGAATGGIIMKIFAKIFIYIIASVFLFSGYGIAAKMVPCPEPANYLHLCYGTKSYQNGAKYIGEWQNHKKNGQGIYTFSNGNIYIGEFLDDNIHGQGTYIFNKNAKRPGEKYVSPLSMDIIV